MIKKSKGSVEWLEFELLAPYPELVHGVFSRHGGVSPPPFDSLNVGGGSGDKESHIRANREIVARTLLLNSLISCKQVHGATVLEVPTLDARIEEGCDGLVTQESGVGLLIKHADCQAVIFYDPVQKKVANIHCGWRGNVLNIFSEALQCMGSRPSDLLACVSPSLGPNAAEFIHYEKEFPPQFYPFQVKPFYFDLWAITRFQLENLGLLPENIQVSQICTYENSQDWFSYRRDKITGRHATVVALIQ